MFTSAPPLPSLPRPPLPLALQYLTLYLYPIDHSFIPKRIPLSSNKRIKVGRQINADTAPSESNGYFNARGLSGRHAEIWKKGGRIFIKDVKSSNGTFINGERLSPQGIESEPFELKSDDIVRFGSVTVHVLYMFNYQGMYVEVITRAERQRQWNRRITSLLAVPKSLGAVTNALRKKENINLVRNLLYSPDNYSLFRMRSPSDIILLFEVITYLLPYVSSPGIEDAQRRIGKLIFSLEIKTMTDKLLIKDVELVRPFDDGTEDSGCFFLGQYRGQRVTMRLTYGKHNKDVCVFDNSSNKNPHTKTYYRHILAWRSLSHHRILPLFGLFEVESRLFLVSPLIINRTLAEWRKTLASDVAQINKLMREVAEGLHYIHSEGIVHGHLCGENILLDSNFHCQIINFGLTRPSTESTSHMIKFSAPELIRDRCWPNLEACYECREMRGRKTMQTDVYAFGCLYYAIFFDTVPFQDLEQEQIHQLVAGGGRPTRLDTPQMDDDIWKIIQNCWNHNPAERPTMEQIILTFTTISTLSLLARLSELKAHGDHLFNEDTLRYTCELLCLPEHFVIQVASEHSSSSNIKLLLDFILYVLNGGTLIHCGIQDAKKKARKLILKLISPDVIPESLFIAGVEMDSEAVGIGGFGRVFGGKYQRQRVAVKLLDKSHKKRGSLSQDFCREALAWRSLSHRFILPLLGIFEKNSQLYLVSPLMVNGTLSDWRKEKTRSISELRRVMLEVAEGLQYIHSEGIVHGDLHGGNVLLDSRLHCQITDFGSTRHFEATVTQSTTALYVSFAAPELFGMCVECGHFDCEGCYEGYEEHHRSKTMKTDIYAFGCLYYSIFFDTVPFHGTNDFQIIRFLTKGRRPHRLKDPKMADNTWNLIQDCWKSIPSERPVMEQIVKILTP